MKSFAKFVWKPYLPLTPYTMTLTGKQLRLLRVFKQIKQEEAARQLRVSQQRYSALENSHHILENRIPSILSALRYTTDTALRVLQSVAD